MVRSSFIRRLALAAVLVAALPAVAPWCDVWCASAHHAEETTALIETPSSEHDHCLNLAQADAAPSIVIEGVRVPSLSAGPSATCEAPATAVLTSVPRGLQAPVAVDRVDTASTSFHVGLRRPALAVAGPAPPLISSPRPLALRL